MCVCVRRGCVMSDGKNHRHQHAYYTNSSDDTPPLSRNWSDMYYVCGLLLPAAAAVMVVVHCTFLLLNTQNDSSFDSSPSLSLSSIRMCTYIYTRKCGDAGCCAYTHHGEVFVLPNCRCILGIIDVHTHLGRSIIHNDGNPIYELIPS